ncbi:MAG: hypothetical protein LBJ02_08180 [Bifidobacteriaceae bacterium]|jgi:hypothetical protein|nr:hypothetical protein [Bifidobacteriaceae bacterium]
MNKASKDLGVALDLWAVRLLTSFSFRLRTRTFLGAATGAVALATALAGGIAYNAVAASRYAVGPGGIASEATLRWGAVVALAAVQVYLAVGVLLREAFSRARVAVRSSPMRDLWIALDVPLRWVVAVERGSEQVPRLLVTTGAVAGAASALLAMGALWPGLAALGTVGISLLAEASCHRIALRSAQETRTRRLPGGVWELYAMVFGASLGVALPVGIRLMSGVDAAGVSGALLRVNVTVLGAAAVVLAFIGLTGVVLAVRAVAGEPAGDLPVLDIDAPAFAAQRLTIWPRGPRWTRPGAIAWGTGSMMVQPAVLSVFRLLLVGCGAAVGAWLTAGPVLADRVFQGVSLEDAARVGAIVAVAGLGSFVAVVTVVVAGQSTRLWEYRTMWEQGGSAVTLWSGHVMGGLIQAAAFGAVATAAVAALTGRVDWIIVVVAISVVLADLLGDSLFARPAVGDSDGGSASGGAGIVSFVAAAPVFVAAVAGGLWASLACVYVAALAAACYLCFAFRLRVISMVPRP